jgi:hypothetical protein
MRKAFISLHLEAEKMKRLLIALLVCFVFSPVAQAGKPSIGNWNDPGLTRTDNAPLPGSDIGSCTYEGDEAYSVFVRARRNTELSMALVTDTETVSLYTRVTGSITSFGTSYRPYFEVDSGVSWTLVWMLSSTKGKHKIVDLVEVTSDTCP